MQQHRARRLAEFLSTYLGTTNPTDARAEVMRRTQLSKGRLSQMLSSGFGERAGESLAEKLRITDRRWFDRPIGTPPSGADLKKPDPQAEVVGLLPSGNRIPVVGSAQLGDTGVWVELEFPVGHGDGYVDLPSRDPAAYAVRCRGDSMAPRIRHGEIVVIEPHTNWSPGDEVLVKHTDGRVMVKTFLYRRDGRVHLGSVNDAHPTIAVDESEIEAIHLVAAIVKPGRLVIE